MSLRWILPVSLAVAAGPCLAQFQLDATLTTRKDHALSHDPATQQGVLYGGADQVGSTLDDGWSRGNSSWSLSLASGGPALRAHGMAHYPVSASASVLLLVGGILPNGSFSSTSFPTGTVSTTYTYSGNGWSNVTLPVDPPPRRDPQVVYDPVRAMIVLHGGRSPAGSFMNDTWTWSPATGWSQVFTTPPRATAPDQRAMAFNPVTNRMTLVVLSIAGGFAYEYYEFDGSNWQAFPVVGSDPNLPLYGFSAATAPSGLGIVVFGGWNNIGAATGSVRIWNGTSTVILPGFTGRGRFGAKMAYDSARNRVIVQGGSTIGYADVFAPVNDTWEWDGAVWQYKPDASYPDYREFPLLVATPTRGGCFLDGGADAFGRPADTWTFQSGVWRRLGGASGVTYGSGAHDPVRDRVVRYDGTRVLEHDGTAWSSVPVTAPRPGASCLLLYDPSRNGVLGYDAAAQATWLWNGVQWSQIAGGAPSAPTNSSLLLVWDSIRQQPLLIGNDGLWALTAQGWAQRWSGTAPWHLGNNMLMSSAAFDPSRDRVLVLAFSVNASGPPRSSVYTVYQWDGTSWDNGTPLGTFVGWGPSMAYVPELQASVIVGGADTWILSSATPSSFRSLGAGCLSSPLGVPLLTSPLSGPWIQSTFQMSVGGTGPGAAPLLGIFGVNRTQWGSFPLPLDLAAFGAPGCSLYVDPLVSVALSGPTWSIGIPNAPTLVGMTGYVQASLLAPTANNLGVLVTNGAELRIGRR